MHLRGLYAITPDWPDSRRMLTAVESALKGGASALQLRRKGLPAAQVETDAGELAALCRQFGIPFIVNDDVELARRCGADGVHLGREDGGVASARMTLGKGGIIGVSCYGDLSRVDEADRAGADYVAVGSIFSSATKPAAAIASLSALSSARELTQLPLVGIGGIDLQNAEKAKDAGADMIAVISALFTASSVEDTARIFSDMWK